MLPKQPKFDLKCSKMRWRLGFRPQTSLGELTTVPKTPNREGNPIPS